MNHPVSQFKQIQLPSTPKPYSNLEMILHHKKQTRPYFETTLPLPKFVVHKQTHSQDLAKLTPSHSRAKKQHLSLDLKSKEILPTSKKRKSNVRIHLYDLNSNDNPSIMLTPTSKYLGLKKLKSSSRKQIYYNTSQKYFVHSDDGHPPQIKRSEMLHSYLKTKKTRDKDKEVSFEQPEDTTNFNQILIKSKTDIKLISHANITTNNILESNGKQSETTLNQIQKYNQQRFDQAIQQFFNKNVKKRKSKESKKQNFTSFDFEQKQPLDIPKPQSVAKAQSKEEINLKDVQPFNPQKLSNDDIEDKDEKLRAELMNSIQTGKKIIAKQTQMMQNKQYQCLVNEGRDMEDGRVIDYAVVRRELIRSLHYIRRLKLTPKMILEQQVFSYKPYQKQGSYEFIMACKSNDRMKLVELLGTNRFLVFDFDYIQMTGLHWACKRGHMDIVTILLKEGADVNACDLIGRTALSFAIEANNRDLVRVLLENQASPWSNQILQYNELCREKKQMMSMINKARKLHILLRMTPPQLREEMWKQQTVNGIKL